MATPRLPWFDEFVKSYRPDVPLDEALETVQTSIQIEEEPASSARSGSAAEQLRILKDRAGQIQLATSRKISNLRVNIGKVLLEGVPKTASLLTGVSHLPHLVVPLLALNYLAFLLDVATVKISEADAKVAIELFQESARSGRRALPLDGFYKNVCSKLDLKADQVDASLDRLQKIGTLTRLNGEVVLNEDVRVVTR